MRIEPFAASNTPKTMKLSGRLSLVALLAGLGAGCGGVVNLPEPIFTGSTSNQQQILASNAGAFAGPAPGAGYAESGHAPSPYAGAQTAAVQQSDLPPPGGAPAPAYGQPAPAYPQMAYAAPNADAPQPYVPPKPYAANGLPTPVGQVNSVAPIPAAPPLPAAPPPVSAASSQLGAPPTTLNQQAAQIGGPAAGGAYVVKSGDTLWGIAQRHGVSADQLMAANGGSATVRIGQTLTIPGAAAEPNVQVASVDPQSIPAPVPAVVTEAPPAPVAAPADTAAPVQEQAAVAAPTGAAGAEAPAAPPATAQAAGFRWPVRGRVISEFGKTPDGERNDGINLAVPEGTSVKAAEDGTVIYAGNELKSYGNLVLIRHSNGWVSAYAHNSELKVERGQQIRRGEIIALSGMSGGVTTPQVHFELRKDATPVNPLQHLTEG